MKKLILISALMFSFNSWAECISGNCFNGEGTYIWSNGDQYIGGWKNGNKHGKGTYTYALGYQYIGEFKNGKVHGQGTMSSPDGNPNPLEFKNGELIGAGEEVDSAEKENPFNAWFEDLEYPRLVARSNYDGAVVCFNSDTKLYDIDDIRIYDTQLNGSRRYIKYEATDFFGNVRDSEIVWDPKTSTSCNITYNTTRDVCVLENGKETNMKNCKK